ncbi:MAG: membrane integrity-associated transporter subunit PqiC [Planctomycetes bacterium]|nr:membrane integrity-associated transporter subunit PqiC [Planctomycetota bacterium]MCB9870980.1 membrane integrity-associated transporter subunit PqiC [Planctomycetota bacterium]MCB9888340.1 membrane integrity-associated transporter subunit PqiC [Planctomycetota bacterium]
MCIDKRGSLFWSVSPLLALGLAGCFRVDLDDLAKEPPSKQRFMLDVKLPAEPTALSERQHPVLIVESVHAVAPYNGRPFVYRTGPSRYETDFYAEFLVDPGQQLTQLTRQWLQATQAFPVVVDSASGVVAQFALTMDLTELVGDFRDAGKPKAVVALRAVLTRVTGERAIVWQKAYRVEKSIRDRDPTSLAAGWGDAVRDLLGQVAGDVRSRGQAK